MSLRSALTLAAVAASAAQQTKIALSTANVIQAFGVNFYTSNATALLDEQALAGDPAAGKGGTVSSAWESTWDATWYGAQVHPLLVIDLKGTYDLTSVWLYRGWGHYNITVAVTDYPADPSKAVANWVWGIGSNTPAGQGWISQNFSSPLRASYISLTVDAPPGNAFVETVVYGTLVSTPPAVTPKPLPAPVFGQLLGTNTVGALASVANLSGVVGAVREYSDWDWTEHVQDQNAFSPTADNNFDYDAYYGWMASLGITGHHCMQKSAGWIHDENSKEESWKPLPDALFNVTGSAMVAANYAYVADHAYQVAARYGKVAVPTASLKLAPNQKPLTGLGTSAGIEIFNEVDGTWNGGRPGFFAPYEYAAMISAAYDGHGGTMGQYMGAKAADPSFPVIHSGLADLPSATGFFEGVRLWSAAFRPKGDFPADVLNVHAYCRNAAGSTGVAPDAGACALEAELTALCAYRDEKLPGLPIWLSEFGWDTVGGPSYAPPVGPYNPQEVQGMWLIRAVLLLARLQSPGGGPCISRAHMYMLADVESTSGGVFATSGLLASPDFFYASKTSWYYYGLFFKRLANYTFAGMVTVPGAPSTVMAQCFKSSTGSAGYALVVWSATDSAAVVTGVNVPVATTACPVHSSTASTMQFIMPANGAPNGNATTVPMTGSGAAAAAVVTVTEVPTILVDA